MRTVVTYLNAQAPNYAAGLAFNTLLAMFPLLLGGLAIVGLVIHDSATQLSFQATVTAVFPGPARPEILAAIDGVRRSAGLLGVVSLLGLLWAGTNLFAGMEFALAQLFGSTRRGPIRQRAMGFVMLLVFILTVGVDVFANALLTLLPDLPYAGFGIGVIAMFGLLVAVYRLVPNRTFGLSHIWPGALVAAVLIEALTLMFPLYARFAHGVNTYGQQFALFFVLALWVFFLCQIILAGAIFIRVGADEPDRGGLFASADRASRVVVHPDEVVSAEAHSTAADN